MFSGARRLLGELITRQSLTSLFRGKLQAETKAPLVLEVARRLDETDVDGAFSVLLQFQPGQQSEREIRLLATFWRRCLVSRHAADLQTQDVVTEWLDRIDEGRSTGQVWPAVEKFDVVRQIVGDDVAARAMFCLLWQAFPNADTGLKSLCFVQALQSGAVELAEDALAYFIRSDPAFVPDAWQFQAMARLWLEDGRHDLEVENERLVDRLQSPGLLPLLAVYEGLMRQRNRRDVHAAARALSDSSHRQRVAQYLEGASHPPTGIGAAVALHDDLAPAEATVERAFMQARLAVAENRWSDVLALTERVADHPSLKYQAVCLRALALAHAGDTDNAAAAVRHVREAHAAPWFLRGRAAMMSMTVNWFDKHGAGAEMLAAPALAPGPGKPLAQALWVGPSLRWIEQLSMTSFLLNGWRYKLYVYDEPSGVPAGVEIADASAILPRSAVFREGSGSGAHKGSLGAFSDLFRYALLVRRGGFYTDTDVINIRPFEPEGSRFVASEWTDSGLIGPNGAQMAAPPGDLFQKAALRIAEDRVADGDIHFTRIGPELLAELLAAGGSEAYALMGPEFLNPIGWMETGLLFEDFEQTRRFPPLKTACNLHVYTETWRLLGHSLAEAPTGPGFLARLNERLMNASPKPGLRTSDLIF